MQVTRVVAVVGFVYRVASFTGLGNQQQQYQREGSGQFMGYRSSRAAAAPAAAAANVGECIGECSESHGSNKSSGS